MLTKLNNFLLSLSWFLFFLFSLRIGFEGLKVHPYVWFLYFLGAILVCLLTYFLTREEK
jgi:hypothetical protein